MILSVTFEKSIYNTIPYKFEAGTPPIAAAIGLGAAIDYLSAIGMDAIAAHELELLNYATEQMNRMPGVRIIGTARDKASVISFAVDGVHPHDTQSGGYRGAHRTSLRAAGNAALLRAGHIARLVCVLQQHRRSRCID
jgi:selenocysteine lyase/cysteine desulfurase